MARNRVKLAWIPNDAARRTTFRKRRKGIIKKVSELSTLCDIQSAAIIYGPNDPAPEVYPSVEGAAAVLERFYAMPETEQTKKMMNQEKFLGDRIAKTSMQLEKVQKENGEAECTALLFRCLADMDRVQELDITATMSLAWMVEMKMRTVKDRIQALKEQQKTVAGVQQPPVASMQPTAMPLQQPFFAAPEYGDGMIDQVFCPPDFGHRSDGYLQLPGVIASGASISGNINPADVVDRNDYDNNMNFKNLSWVDRYFPK